MYCRKCGGKVDNYASHCPFCGEPVASNNVEVGGHDTPVEEKKGVWSWILTLIIASIPVLDIIFLLIWSFGSGTKNKPTFRNWARAVLALALIGTVLIIALSIIMVVVYGPEAADKIKEIASQYQY